MSTDDNKTPVSDSEVLLSALVEAAVAGAGEHPSVEALVDYLAGDLEAEVEARVQDHLVACRQCAATLLDLEALGKLDAEPTEGVADLELEAAWRELQSRIQGSEGSSRSPGYHRWPVALAASLLVAVVGLSAWVNQLQRSTADLQRRVAQLSRPQINPPIVYLDEITRSEPGGAVAELPVDQPFVLLIVIPSAPEGYSSFEAVLTGGAGEVVWSGNGLELSGEGTLRMRLPRDLLPAGEYRVQVQGVIDGQKETVIETSLRLVDE